MTYRFWLKTYSGQYLAWTGLSKSEALAMYRTTPKNTPETIKSFGWETTT